MSLHVPSSSSINSSSSSSSSIPTNALSTSSSSQHQHTLPAYPDINPSLPLFNTISHETAVFAHAVNDRERVTIALNDRTINIFEADIILDTKPNTILSNTTSSVEIDNTPNTGAGAMPSSNISNDDTPIFPYKAVMGHTPGDTYDLTVEEWLQLMNSSGRGIKLDIKEYNAIDEILYLLSKFEGNNKEEIKRNRTNATNTSSSSDNNNDNIIRNEGAPGILTSNFPFFRIYKTINSSSSSISASFDIPAIIVNADILTGTTLPLGAAAGCVFNPEKQVLSTKNQIYYGKLFLDTVIKSLPLAILSPGWTTAGEYRTYTLEMIQNMVEVIHEYAISGIPITFPVRGTYVQSSYPLLKKYLLDPYSSTSLTIWSNVLLTESEEEWLRTNLDPQRTMYDLVPRSSFHPGATAAFAIQKLLNKRTPWKIKFYNHLRNFVADIWSQLLDNEILSSTDNSLNITKVFQSTPIKVGIFVSSIISIGLFSYNHYIYKLQHN